MRVSCFEINIVKKIIIAYTEASAMSYFQSPDLKTNDTHRDVSLRRCDVDRCVSQHVDGKIMLP